MNKTHRILIALSVFTTSAVCSAFLAIPIEGDISIAPKDANGRVPLDVVKDYNKDRKTPFMSLCKVPAPVPDVKLRNACIDIQSQADPNSFHDFRILYYSQGPSMVIATCWDKTANKYYASAKCEVSETIRDVRVGQTIFQREDRGEVVLVLGKSAAIELSIGNLPAVGKTVKLDIKVNGTPLAQISRTVSADDINTNKGLIHIDADKKTFFLPSGEGAFPIELTVTMENQAPIKKAFTAKVIKTNTPKIGVVRMSCLDPDCYGETQANPLKLLTNKEQNTFLNNVLPVPDNSIRVRAFKSIIKGTPVRTPLDRTKDTDGYAIDMKALNKKRSRWELDRLVGVAPAGYFRYQLEDPNTINQGVTITTTVKSRTYQQVSIIIEPKGKTQTSLLAHELGHTFQVREEYSVNGKYHVEPDAYPLDVKYQKGLFDGFSASELGAFGAQTSFMGPDYGTLESVWVDPNVYKIIRNTLAKSLKFPIWYTESRVGSLDQVAEKRTIMVSGLVYKDGTFSADPVEELASGLPTNNDPEGTLQIRLLDSKGSELYKVSQTPSFQLHTIHSDGQIGRILQELNSSPVVVQLPYDPTAASVEILSNGLSVAKFPVVTSQLRSLISAIPYEAFQENTKGHLDRIEFLNLTSAVEQTTEKLMMSERNIMMQTLVSAISLKTANTFQLMEPYSSMTKDDLLKSISVMVDESKQI